MRVVTQSVNGFELLTDGSLAEDTKERIWGLVWVARQQVVGSTVRVVKIKKRNSRNEAKQLRIG